jgi:hypothetical protein
MINHEDYGVSFSIKQCRNFGVDPHVALDWLLARGWRRFRLMSYWDEHEKQPDVYDFAQLDWQIARIAEAGGVVTLCLGVKQPRWPEYHWPRWAWEAEPAIRDKALLRYVQKTVEHYKNNPVIISYQLENEALLSNFGEKIDINRTRLRQEMQLVRRTDPTRPVSMSTSNGWGVPARKPRADIIGFSCYFRLHSHGRYHTTVQSPWLHRLRRVIIRGILHKPVFIHELQCEPWGPTAIWKMPASEQDKSMSPTFIGSNIAAARSIGVGPIDLWGSEWWYWRHAHGDDTIWQAVAASLALTVDEQGWMPVQ